MQNGIEKAGGHPFPVCEILGVPVSVTNMEQVTGYLEESVNQLRGRYVCVGNVHTTVMAFEDEHYMQVQRGASFVLPDGKPLSARSRKRGFPEATRVTGPDLMRQMFLKGNVGDGLRHYFYGSTEDILRRLSFKLKEQYPKLEIAGMYAPPFRELTEEENERIISKINAARPDIIWVGLGAPKQENWMALHEGLLSGLMIGVGAGFDFHAGTLRRAPGWVQEMGLEWLFRLSQDPKRLWKRYLMTNSKFLMETKKESLKKRC